MRYRGTLVNQLAKQVYLGQLALSAAFESLEQPEQVSLLARLHTIRKGQQSCKTSR